MAWRRRHVGNDMAMTGRDGHVTMTWKVRQWRGWPRHHTMTRVAHVFMTVLYDYKMDVATLCHVRLNVHYKSSIITENLLVIVVRNNINCSC